MRQMGSNSIMPRSMGLRKIEKKNRREFTNLWTGTTTVDSTTLLYTNTMYSARVLFATPELVNMLTLEY